MAELIIDIAADGAVRIEGKDVEGPACLALSREIEKALGTVQTQVKKPEFHRAATQRRGVTR